MKNPIIRHRRDACRRGIALSSVVVLCGRAQKLHDRRVQHRARQWLARTDDLRDAGPSLGRGRCQAKLIVAHRNTDSAPVSLRIINNLIEAGVDAIVLNPSNPEALNSALDTGNGARHCRCGRRCGRDR